MKKSFLIYTFICDEKLCKKSNLFLVIIGYRIYNIQE
jgi:hypothetical protein